MLFKLLFLGYLFSLRSERQLIRNMQGSVAYRWFLGLNPTDKVPDASTFSQSRCWCFNEPEVYQQIFDEIVLQAMRKKPITGRGHYTDSDSGYMVRDGKPKGFFYLDHPTVDGVRNIITGVHVTPGNCHGSKPCLKRLDWQKECFGFDIKALGVNVGYFAMAICNASCMGR